MLLSLVQTSQNRRKELYRFVRSLNEQININFKDIQIVFIDQEDNRDVFDELNPNINFTYIKSQHCSLSHARNIGISFVKGKFIAFPDDDCWYESDTLSKALHLLNKGQYQGITGKGTNDKGVPTSTFPRSGSELTIVKRCAAISYTMFFKFCPDMYFDEAMGVGSKFNLGSGEETDYLLTLMEKYKYKVYYDPSIIIHHPTYEIYDKEIILKRTYSYARGFGYLTKKHVFPILYVLNQFFRPFIGIFVNLFKLDFFSLRKSYLNLQGRIEGYFFKIKLK